MVSKRANVFSARALFGWMPDGPDFDIYQTSAGYTAVTNAVRRQILDALGEHDRELPDLVKITGKSKPTLSNLHVRELLAQNLVEEMAHPTDARKKVYRLKARRIGRSNVPLEQLRGAVKHYVSLSPLAYAVPFPAVVGAVAQGHPAAPRDALRKQGQALGEAASHLFATTGARDVLTAVAGFWERENVAKTIRVDFEKLEVEVEIGDAVKAPSVEGIAIVLGAVVEGVLRSRLGADGPVQVRMGRGRRATLTLPK
jgi:hypothetical protein